MTPLSFFVLFFVTYVFAFYEDIVKCIGPGCNAFYLLGMAKIINFIELIYHFYMGYATDTKPIIQQSKIIRRYVFGLFIFDLCGSIPAMLLNNLFCVTDTDIERGLHDIVVLKLFTLSRFFNCYLKVTLEVKYLNIRFG